MEKNHNHADSDLQYHQVSAIQYQHNSDIIHKRLKASPTRHYSLDIHRRLHSFCRRHRQPCIPFGTNMKFYCPQNRIRELVILKKKVKVMEKVTA